MHELSSRYEYDIFVTPVLQKSEPRISVNNKDIIQMYLGYKLIISQKTVPINACFVDQQTMASGCNHQSKLPLYIIILI